MVDNNYFLTKQKIIGLLVVILIGLIVWQVFELFFKENNSPAIPKPIANQSIKTTNLSSSTVSKNPANNTPPNANVPSPASVPVLVSAQTDVQPDASEAIIQAQEENQVAYLDLINKLQNLKIQKEIAETSQAIAVAKLATATAEKNMSGLIIESSQDISINYANKPTTGKETNATTISSLNAPPIPENNYAVLSVSKELGHWQAVISDQGKLYTVSVGDKIPGTQIVVNEISINGVVLFDGKKKQAIRIVTSI